jgi:hypothetical protein
MSPIDAEKPRASQRKSAAGRDGENQPSLLTSAALIGIGSLIEPELLAGMVIGAGIVFASRWLPDLMGGVLRPAVKTTVRAGYAVAEAVSEAVEQTQDIVAEIRAEREKGAGGDSAVSAHP